ncbi:MAG: hypothetical protein AB8B96_03200 [Lysobacterales bacterium]
MSSRLLLAGGSLAMAVVAGIFAWQQSMYAFAKTALDRWVEHPTPAVAAQIDTLVRSAQALPDPQFRWLSSRWKMARDPFDRSVLSDFAVISQARPYDYRPAVGAARWWAANDPSAEEFGDAMDAAMTLGPNESRVFAALFPLARVHWHYLSPDQRQRQQVLLTQTALREPALAIELSLDYGFAGSACSLTGENSLAQEHCKRLGIIEMEMEMEKESQ